jgi:FkbM family methyltransferase
MQDIFSFLAQHGMPLPRSVIQVGASVGQELDLFSKNGVTRGVFIEALHAPYALLLQNLSNYDNIRSVAVNCCITSFDNKSEVINVASNFGQSSSIYSPTRHLEVYPNVHFNEKVSVNGFSLDGVMTSVVQQTPELNYPFDMLFLDVQGAELNVLKGASKTLSYARYIYTEVTFGTDYDGAVKYTDVILYLTLHGFELCALEIDPSCRAHGNAIFVKLF